jgi:hypothetical protein
VATNAVTFVPLGTVTNIVFAFSLMTPPATGLVNEKAVTAFAEDADEEFPGTPPSPLPHDNIVTKKYSKSE